MCEFEKIINYKFKNNNLLKQAFTHSSYAHENKIDALKNNERLEFLGDAVLELIISEYLYKKFFYMSEGDLTKFRASLVCENCLAKNASKINIGKFILLGKGEEQTGGRKRDSILANTFEAIIGAIFLDGGNEYARNFIIENLKDDILKGYSTFNMNDAKTYLQELLQKTDRDFIQYFIINEEGPDHDKTFTASVVFKNKEMGIGKGKSKKEAEQCAAYNAIENIESNYNN